MKMFKLTMIAIIMTLGFFKNSYAKAEVNGVYLTENDYVNHKLSYGYDPNNAQGNKIILNDFLEGKNVTVVINSKKQVLPKNELFGYRKDGHDYRFQDNKVYEIVDSEGFYLYTHDKLVQNGKGLKPVKEFYFSIKANSEIVQLTQQNIDKAFASNYKFRLQVQADLPTDQALGTYDKALNKYEIKEIFAESSK
ncbi:MAG: hypothetical protein JO080_09250 [Mucilaginibacter sp.]|nr:hypothetical protein [Mucilaginibacter sp.]